MFIQFEGTVLLIIVLPVPRLNILAQVILAQTLFVTKAGAANIIQIIFRACETGGGAKEEG